MAWKNFVQCWRDKVKDLRKTEDLLHSFQRKPLPPGMKEKILRTANQEAAQMRPLVNSFRRVVAVCSALIAVVILLDMKISENQRQKISLLQKTTSGSESAELEDELAIILDLINETNNSSNISWIKIRYFRGKKSTQWLNRNREFQIFMEDFNGS